MGKIDHLKSTKKIYNTSLSHSSFGNSFGYPTTNHFWDYINLMGMVLIVHTRHLTYFGRFLPFSRIRTLIDGVEGGHADHLTNPTAHDESPFVSYLLKLNRKIISETYFVPGLRIKLEVGSSSLSYSANIKWRLVRHEPWALRFTSTLGWPRCPFSCAI